MHGCEDIKGKAQEIKGEAGAARGGIDVSVAGQNLINTVTVSVTSGTVLLGLWAARHF
jgi:hypothetical protein